MRVRLTALLSTLPFVLLGMTADLRAQQQDWAARRVIIFVWDGLRADDLTPEIRRTISRSPDPAPFLQTTTPSIRPSR